jgi:formylglycine-generating enzyme required for sulfatase activity
MTAVPTALRRLVIQQAADRCEYCALSQAGQEATLHLDHIIPQAAGGETVSDNIALAYVSRSLRAHRCLLVFDDLDEVRQEWRGLVQRAVVTVINHYQPHRVSVTCRTRSYLGDATLPGFNAFTLTPLDAKQFASFASAWYNTQRELGRVDAVQARQKGTNLAAVALQPALRALAANPMLLTAMALIHQQDTRHPEELLFNNIRNGARELFYLAAGLLEDELPTQQMQRAALWSGQMALMASGEWIKRGARTPQRGQAYFRRLVPHMVTLLTSDLTVPERCQAGEVLGQFGNPRFQAEAWYSPDEPLLGFVEIPIGPFLFGSDPACDPGAFDDEQPQHEISSPRYFIGRYPVTMAQFLAFVRDSSYQPQLENSLHGQTNHPVVDVSWYEACQYCKWLTERLREWPGTPEPMARLLRDEGWQVMLPSEAEWEKAGRGSSGRIYPWGDSPAPNRANYDDTGFNTTSAVGCFPGGASLYGVEDLSGNVWEWTRSLKRAYPYRADQQERARRENLRARRNRARVLRGGAFNVPLRVVRCAYRVWGSPDLRFRYLGFLVVVCPCR